MGGNLFVKSYSTNLANDALADYVAHDLVGSLQNLVHAAVAHIALDLVVLRCK